MGAGTGTFYKRALRGKGVVGGLRLFGSYKRGALERSVRYMLVVGVEQPGYQG